MPLINPSVVTTSLFPGSSSVHRSVGRSGYDALKNIGLGCLGAIHSRLPSVGFVVAA